MARILITGISGFIAKHVALAALNEGHDVRGTVRSAAKGDAVRAAIARAGGDGARLSFVEADLTSDAGWREAVAGMDAVLHVASPFPLSQPKDREALTPAARDGALRVVRAALEAGVERVVVTSSMVAMAYRPGRHGDFAVTEGDWSDPEWSAASAYMISKTRAERAVWAFADEHGAREKVVAINPGLVLGPPLDAEIGTSLEVVKLFLTGAYPAMPPVAFTVVDVRDLALAHVRAATAPGVGGRRLIAAHETISLKDMALMLREAIPERAKRIPTAVLPAWLVRMAAAFDPALRSVVHDLGARPIVDSRYVTELTGVAFRPARESVADAGRALVAAGLA